MVHWTVMTDLGEPVTCEIVDRFDVRFLWCRLRSRHPVRTRSCLCRLWCFGIRGQCRVGAIAVGWVLGVFAQAEMRGLTFFSVESDGRELATCVRSIAERLAARFSARTPVKLLTLLKLNFNRLPVGDFGTGHSYSSAFSSSRGTTLR